jgi:hypothetical protein
MSGSRFLEVIYEIRELSQKKHRFSIASSAFIGKKRDTIDEAYHFLSERCVPNPKNQDDEMKKCKVQKCSTKITFW